MDRTSTHFVFVIEPGFTMQAFSSAVEVLRVARKLGAARELAYSVATPCDGPVQASNGISVLPDLRLDDMPPGACLVVVSGAGTHETPNPRLIAALRRLARQGHAIWAVSSGIVRLAQAGLVDHCEVAAHWEDVPYLKAHHPRVRLTASLFVIDAKHPTCSGGGAVADLMLSYIQRHVSADLVEDIASCLMLDGVRNGRLRQAMPAHLRFTTSNRTAFAAIRLMEANRFTGLPIHEIARLAGVSQRQLERLFKQEFGRSPATVYTELRLSEARQEVLSGYRPLLEIALDYGFQPGHFAKVYRRVFGIGPSEDRKADLRMS